MGTPRRVGLLLVTLLVACGGVATGVGLDGGDPDASSGRDSGEADGRVLFEDAGVDASREANASSCPGAYSSTPPGHCTIGLMCSYDQGRCECAGSCGGAPPPPDVDFSHWACAPKVDNGCPDTRPASGDACNLPARSCSYGVCCVETFLCGQSGKWTSGGLACPP